MKDISHIDDRIQDYLDGALPPDERRRVVSHLHECRRCANRVLEMEALLDNVRKLPRFIEPPATLWKGVADCISDREAFEPASNGLNADLNGRSDARPFGSSSGPIHTDRPPARVSKRRRKRVVAASAIAPIVLILSVAVVSLSTGTWDVERLTGTPRVAEADVVTTESMRSGDWLTTDSRSRARLRAGVIGDVDVQPNTRIQLRETRLNDHRIALEAGQIEARIWAPPRLFIVETPAATAIDLGCVYTLSVDSSGHSLLSVKSGYVELQRDGRSSVVPAGAMCIARREFGPGTAFAADASQRFREALERYDFGGSAPKDLAIVLEEARAEDAVTLWQIFERSEGHDRAKVYDRLTDLVIPPSDVKRKDVLMDDPAALRAWRMHLGLEALTWWAYVWRKLAFWKDG